MCKRGGLHWAKGRHWGKLRAGALGNLAAGHHAQRLARLPNQLLTAGAAHRLRGELRGHEGAAHVLVYRLACTGEVGGREARACDKTADCEVLRRSLLSPARGKRAGALHALRHHFWCRSLHAHVRGHHAGRGHFLCLWQRANARALRSGLLRAHLAHDHRQNLWRSLHRRLLANHLGKLHVARIK